MKRGFVVLLVIASGSVAGVACSELFCRWPAARAAIARTLGRGELVAIVNGAGIYEADGDAAELVISAKLRREGRDEHVSPEKIDRELELLRHQFGDAKIFDAELEASELSPGRLRDQIAEHLRAQQWVEKQIAFSGA